MVGLGQWLLCLPGMSPPCRGGTWQRVWARGSQAVWVIPANSRMVLVALGTNWHKWFNVRLFQIGHGGPRLYSQLLGKQKSRRFQFKARAKSYHFHKHARCGVHAFSPSYVRSQR
jgi:hypothetical protein